LNFCEPLQLYFDCLELERMDHSPDGLYTWDEDAKGFSLFVILSLALASISLQIF